MSGPTDPPPPPGGPSGLPAGAPEPLPRRGASTDERAFLDLNELSIEYAQVFRDRPRPKALVAAEALLRRSAQLLDGLPRWWLSERTPAFTAVSTKGVVYQSEPIWPTTLWPQAHQIWVEAASFAILAKQYADHGALFYLGCKVVSIQADLLAFLEQDGREPGTHFDKDLDRLGIRVADLRKDFETRAGSKARSRYLAGVGVGLLVVSPVSLALLFRQSAGAGPDSLIVDAAACAIAGAAGALVSVLTRVTNESLRLDYHIGQAMLVFLGLARPILGAILALALYWATVGEVVPLAPPGGDDARFAFFIAIGFIAGFSERYAQDMLLIRTQPDPATAAKGAPPDGSAAPAGAPPKAETVAPVT